MERPDRTADDGNPTTTERATAPTGSTSPVRAAALAPTATIEPPTAIPTEATTAVTNVPITPRGNPGGLRLGTAIFAWEWACGVIGTSWVPDDRTVIAERLRQLAERMVDALLTEPFRTASAHQVGSDLVAAGFTAPEALGRTLDLMGTRLLTDIGLDPDDPGIRTRLMRLLGGLGTGFAQASHERTLAEQDAIRRSQLAAWQRVEQARHGPSASNTTSATSAPAGGSTVGVGAGSGHPPDVLDRGMPTTDPVPADLLTADAVSVAVGEENPLRLAEEMFGALDRGEIVPFYQPIVRLSDQTVVGFEALARWWHPEQGLLGPERFLGPATGHPQLTRLGRHIRAHACADAAHWSRLAGRPLFVSVNLAGCELAVPGLAGEITEVLARTGLSPTLLHLELAEDAPIGAVERSALGRLAATGVQLALDDVGTGWSRLVDLPALPLRGLKLAGELLNAVHHHDLRRAQAGTDILATLVSIATRLDVTTTAEGVETAGAADLVRRLGVTRAQGWHFGRPLRADEIPQHLGLST